MRERESHGPTGIKGVLAWIKKKKWYWWNYRILGQRAWGRGVCEDGGIQIVEYNENQEK